MQSSRRSGPGVRAIDLEILEEHLMSLQATLDALKKIEQVATLAGLSGEIDEERMAFVMGFGLDQGRRQVVYARAAGRTRDEQTIVRLYSPCLIVKQGFLSGLSKERAIDLLRRNAEILLASYGIVESERESAVIASLDVLLEGLEPQAFLASALGVAIAADMYERKHGKDQF
jgi:hypothetical protein